MTGPYSVLLHCTYFVSLPISRSFPWCTHVGPILGKSPVFVVSLALTLPGSSLFLFIRPTLCESLY